MKSSIYLCGYCELEQEKNFIIDNQETLIDYIDSLDTFYGSNNFQYIKHDLEIVIKINDSQVDLTNNLINYCKIKNEDDQFPVYYFVTKIQAGAEHTNRVYLKMDTLTTFFTQGRMTLNDKTKVIRQHKDRFFQNASGQLQRKVDNISEGVQPIQFKVSEIKIEDDNSNRPLDWYLIYRTKNQLSPDDISNPLNCYLVADKTIAVSSGNLTNTTIIPSNDFQNIYSYMFLNKNNTDGGTITLNYGTSKTSFKLLNNSVFIVEYNSVTGKWDASRCTYAAGGMTISGSIFNYANINSIVINAPLSVYYKVSGSIEGYSTSSLYYYWYLSENSQAISTGLASNLYLNTIDEIDKTDTRIMKIIKLPYSPSDFNITTTSFTYDTSSWQYDGGLLKLKNLSTEFEHNLKTINIPNLYVARPNTTNQTARLQYFESKLYSSDYYTYKIGYDSFTKSIDYERLLKGANSYDLIFKMTNTFNSKMLFHIDMDNYKQIEDYELYLPLARNNEISIYSNDFLNYIRSGYNYDKKTLERQSINNIISTAGGVVGGVAAAFSGGAFGVATAITLGVSTLTRLVSSVNQQVQNEQTLESKLKQLSLQSSSVSGSDDVDLMSYYTGNRAVVMTYSVSDEMSQALYDLFYYCGYARNFNEKVDIYSRKNFNFLQCEPVWDKYAYIPNDWLEDMNQRLLAGVTIFHYNNGFDFAQEYENWEVWL